MGEINRIIHLGDIESDAEEIEYTQPYIIDYIAGNCDFCSRNLKEKIITVEGKNILLTHGHYYNVKWEYDTIKKISIEKSVDITLFGHTHIPFLEQNDKITLMNPGSISSPRSGNKPSYGIIEIDKKGVFHYTINFL